MKVAQRYLSALGTSRLKINPNRQTAADVLIATGWVASTSAKRAMALKIFAVLSTEQMRGATDVAQHLAKWIRRKSFEQNKFAMKQLEAQDLAMMVLKWWKRPACITCGGHGHPTIPDSPVLDESKECPVCLGTGLIPLQKIINANHLPLANWLIAEMDGITSSVFDAVARRLRD